jgi:hypothetical protein
MIIRTNDHDIKVESFANAFAVPLVGQIGKANVARELSPHNVSHVSSLLRSGFGVL